MSTLKLDLDALVEQDLISEEQKTAIAAWHRTHSADESGKRFFGVFGTIGAFATGLGILLFIGANWDSMGDVLKTTICIGTTLLFYLLGYIFSYRVTEYPKTGHALTLLGSLSYGASIFLIGQIYNVGGTFYGAFAVWLIGILPIAYITGFSTIFTLALALVYAFIFSYFIEKSWYVSPFLYVLTTISVGYAFLGLSCLHKEKFARFSSILAGIGAFIALAGTFIFTFNDFWREGVSITESTTSQPILWVLGGILTVGLGSIAFDYFKKREYPVLSLISVVAIIPIALLAVYGSTVHSVPYEYGFQMLNFPENLYVIAMNLVYLAATFGIVFAGILRSRQGLVNVGIFFLAVYLFGKYLAFVSDSKMDGAIIFISGGIVCIAIGWLAESVRRRLIGKIRLEK